MLRLHKNENIYRGRLNYLQQNFKNIPSSLGDCKDCYNTSGSLKSYFISFGKQFYFKDKPSKFQPYYGGDIGFSYHGYQGVSNEVNGVNIFENKSIDAGLYFSFFFGLELRLLKRLHLLFEINAYAGRYIQQLEKLNVVSSEREKNLENLFTLDILNANNLLTITYKIK